MVWLCSYQVGLWSPWVFHQCLQAFWTCPEGLHCTFSKRIKDCVPVQLSLKPSRLYRQSHRLISRLSLIRLHCFPPHSHTDLALGFLSLGGVLVVGSFTVRAVVFTVVVGCPGVCHYQQLLDVSLKRKVHMCENGAAPLLVLCNYDHR